MNECGRMKTVVVAGLMLALLCTDTFAHGREGYYYRGDHWYRAGWFGLGVAVAALTVGMVAEALPPRHTTVIVGNEPYYYYDGTYFRPSPGGYVVVPAPVVSQQVIVVPPAAPVVVVTPPAMTALSLVTTELSAVTVNIPNVKGTYTAVTMRRSGNGFIGPQGEYYPEFPKVEQLKLIYGQ